MVMSANMHSSADPGESKSSKSSRHYCLHNLVNVGEYACKYYNKPVCLVGWAGWVFVSVGQIGYLN